MNFKKLFNLWLLGIISLFVIITLYTQPSAEVNQYATENPVPDQQFIIGAFHNGADLDYLYQDYLKFNTWHHYTAPTGWGWRNNNAIDIYTKPISAYEPIVQQVFGLNAQHNMRTFMDRPIIEYLVGGSRVDYQCEYIPANYNDNHYWFYAYDNSAIINNNTHFSINNSTVNINETSEIATVKYCKKLDNGLLESDILINSELRANREMSFNQVNEWLRDDKYEWYVLPRIKIDPTYANDESHNNDVVCRIVVKSWYDNTEEEYNIRVKNFKQYANSNYNGFFFDSFYENFGEQKTYYKILQSKIHNFTNDNLNWIYDWNATCHNDIKIYWTGVCDMWIDRVRIENEPAHQYLTLQDSRWLEKVDAEIVWSIQNYSTSNPIPNYLYFEECFFRHFPVIKELNSRAQYLSGGS